ncbi:MAG: RsmB/NOP family class I SAM-dependent RNA methyltransferase [Pseudomonadota bacterium]
MTPAARYAAAIEILDDIQAGDATEKVLTNWGRSNRFAGSKDRRAIRDIVFDILRRKNEATVLGGGNSGRQLTIGHLRLGGVDLKEIFNGQGYGPSELTVDEIQQAEQNPSLTLNDICNLPDWMFAVIREDQKQEFVAQSNRADVFLRVNARKTSVAAVMLALEEDSIFAEAYEGVPNALRVIDGMQHIGRSKAYLEGLVELQDAGSQGVVHALTLPTYPDNRILDYCAGGGGKTLAIAAKSDAQIFAWDPHYIRMKDLKYRAGRAGVTVKILDQKPQAVESYDYILVDVPCSGSGAWRRNPDGKWKLQRDEFETLLKSQKTILQEVAPFAKQDAIIGYVTCSLFDQENMDQIASFLAEHPEWKLFNHGAFLPSAGTDGFFYAEVKR